MKLIKSLVLSGLFLTVIFITGCEQYPTSSIEPVTTGSHLSKTATSAVLHIWSYNDNFQDVNIHAVTEDWSEMDVTWNNRPSFNPDVEKSFSTNVEEDWIEVDVTALVNKWLSGAIPNFGILLEKSEGFMEVFQSREATNKPFIRVTYSDGSVNIADIADADIFELPEKADVNFGSLTELYAGYYPPENPTYEKQSLLKFDIEYDGGCTLTPGYWKTHSSYGPAPYDDTWVQIGEDTPFFLSGKSYFEVINTVPAGNAYYNLSFHYIAAKLNQLNGADFSAAQSAFDQATTLFQTYTPADIALLKGSHPVRTQFINLASILGQYNEGYIGPGHCDDIEPMPED